MVVVAAAQLRPVALNTKALEWAALPSDTPGMPADGRVVISDRAARLLAEHVIDAIRSLCDRCVVMNSGAKIAEGTPDEVLADEDVIRAYLGNHDA